MLVEEFSQFSDVLIPLLLIVFGVATLAFQRFLGNSLEKYSLQKTSVQNEKNSGHFALNVILERMASRRKMSLSMTLVGIFWLLQSVLLS